MRSFEIFAMPGGNRKKIGQSQGHDSGGGGSILLDVGPEQR